MLGLVLAVALAQQPPADPVGVILAREGCTSTQPWACTDEVRESRAEAQATYNRLVARPTLSPAESRLLAALTLSLGVASNYESVACIGERSVNQQYGRKRITGNCPEDH